MESPSLKSSKLAQIYKVDKKNLSSISLSQWLSSCLNSTHFELFPFSLPASTSALIQALLMCAGL